MNNLFIPQENHNDCAFTSFKILMANIFQNKKYLYVEPPYKRTKYSLYDLIDFAHNYQVDLIGIQVIEKTSFDFSKIEYPFIAEFELVNKQKHVVVVKKATKHKLLVYDPAIGIYELSYDEFNSRWNGISLFIQNIRKPRLVEMKKIEKEKPSLSKIISVASQILSTISIFLGFLYLKEDSSIVIPLVCFLAYFGFFILANQVNKQEFNEIDRNVLKRNNLKYFLRTHFDKITRYKMLSITNPISIVNSIIFAGGLSVILVLNDPNNMFIFFGILALILIERFTIDKTINVLKSDIANGENSILYKELDDGHLAGYYYILSKKSRKLYNLLLFKKWMVSLVVFAGCFTLMVLENQLAMNFLMFYFVAFDLIHDKINEILDFPKKYKEEKELKSIVNNDY